VCYRGAVQSNVDNRPPRVFTDEKTTLVGFLDYLRGCITGKLEGLSPEEARRPMVPSGTSLLGLAKHLTNVELGWFIWSFAGEDIELSPASGELTEQDTVGSVVAGYRAAVARANAAIAAGSIDQLAARARRDPEPPPLRWILVHLLEETARHAGHADILREQIDGSVGR
jgi:hypothetical protein